MNNLQILNENGQLVVTSRQIADNFLKEHKTVLRAIEDIIGDIQEQGVAQNCANLFIETKYQHEQNNQMYKEYLLTRDGFSLLVMGFTGSAALEWKLKYIKAFNEMEQSLKSVQPQLSPELQSIFILDQRTTETNKRIDTLETNMPLFNIECKELQALVRKIGIKALGGYKTPAYNDNSLRTKVYKDIQQQLKREFNIERYEGIKRSQLNAAKKIVNEYKTPLFLHDEIILMNEQCTFLQAK